MLRVTDLLIFEIMFKTLEYGNTPQDVINYLKSLDFGYFYRSTKYFGLLVALYFFEFNLISSTILKYFSPACFFITCPSSLANKLIVFDKVEKSLEIAISSQHS